jgi:hypothetical protein
MITTKELNSNTWLAPRTRLDNFAMSVFLVVMGAGAFLAAWLLFQEATKRALVTDFAIAARQGNIYALNENTDWASVRDWMKRDLKQRPRFATGITPVSKADELVEYYVRPENLPSLLYYYNTNARHMDPEAFVRDVRFSGITEITVEIAAPPQLDKPWINQLEPVRAVFQLEGLGWKLKKLNAPDYLIPSEAPTASFRRGT